MTAHRDSSPNVSAEVVMEAFAALEDRDDARFAAVCHPDFELHWPPELPYGGVGREADHGEHRTWEQTWDPFQPTALERSMDPRAVAATADEVVVLWRQKGLSTGGERLDSPVLGLYRVRDTKLLRAQMFYFDPGAVASFLERWGRPQSDRDPE